MKIHVDDRLIHGQLLYGWCVYYKLNEIVIVSEKVMHNTFQRMLMQAAIVPPMHIEFLSVTEALAAQSEKKLYLFDDLELVKQFYEGLSDRLSIGTTFVISNLSMAVGKMKASPSIYLDHKDQQVIQALNASGLKCIFAQSPGTSNDNF